MTQTIWYHDGHLKENKDGARCLVESVFLATSQRSMMLHWMKIDSVTFANTKGGGGGRTLESTPSRGTELSVPQRTENTFDKEYESTDGLSL